MIIGVCVAALILILALGQRKAEPDQQVDGMQEQIETTVPENDTPRDAVAPAAAPAPKGTGTTAPQSGTSDVAAVRAIITTLGQRMQYVYLTAKHDVFVGELNQQYGQFVAPGTLSEWQQGYLPAPGRRASSPWPARIDIVSVTPSGSLSYVVTGKVVEVTSKELSSGGAAAIYPVSFKLSKQAGKWYIVYYERGADEPMKSEVVVRGHYTCLPHKNTSGGATTLECALGMKGDDGSFYGLTPAAPFSSLQAGDRMEVSGTLTPIAIEQSGAWQNYDVAGVIAATSVKKL